MTALSIGGAIVRAPTEVPDGVFVYCFVCFVSVVVGSGNASFLVNGVFRMDQEGRQGLESRVNKARAQRTTPETDTDMNCAKHRD